MTCVKGPKEQNGWYLRKTERKSLWLKVFIVFDNLEFTGDLDINHFMGVVGNEVRRGFKSKWRGYLGGLVG